jgi:hypothetical protein
MPILTWTFLLPSVQQIWYSAQYTKQHRMHSDHPPHTHTHARTHARTHTHTHTHISYFQGIPILLSSLSRRRQCKIHGPKQHLAFELVQITSVEGCDNISAFLWSFISYQIKTDRICPNFVTVTVCAHHQCQQLQQYRKCTYKLIMRSVRPIILRMAGLYCHLWPLRLSHIYPYYFIYDGLKRTSVVTRLLGLRARIPPGAWMPVFWMLIWNPSIK